MKRSLIAASLITLVTAACSNGPKPIPVSPEQLDRAYAKAVREWDYNRDGVATCQDLLDKRTDLFRSLDADKDGQLNEQEFSGAIWQDKTFQIVRFDIIDTGKNGFISPEELAVVNDSSFGRYDANGNCRIERQELEDYVRDQMRRPGARGGKNAERVFERRERY